MATKAGIRVTQPGVSVPFAADYQYVFNSDWPSIAIAFEAVVTVTTTATVKHGLGFYPLTMGWSQLNGVSIGRIFAISGNLKGPQNDVSLTFDKQNIYLTNAGAFNATYQVSLKCYNLDISKNADYTLPKFPVVQTKYDPSTGIKVTKYGKSIGSNDLRDYILHSRAQSPAVLTIVTTPTLNVQGFPVLGYTNPTSYMPWVLAFTGGPGLGQPYSPLAPGAQQSGYQFVILSKVNINPLFFGGYQMALTHSATKGSLVSYGSLVVLRDPLVVANTRRIVY